MLTKEERLFKIQFREGVSRHAKLASEVLSQVGKELRTREMGYLDDANWLYHLIIPDGKGKWISLFCGGFDKYIDVQYLRKNGDLDNRYEEKRFMTPKGATNHAIRLIEKHGRL